MTIRAAALREELHTEVERILNDVIKFKIHIQQKLEEYEAFVDEEVSKEFEALNGDEMPQDVAPLNDQSMVMDEEAEIGAYDDHSMMDG